MGKLSHMIGQFIKIVANEGNQASVTGREGNECEEDKKQAHA